MSKNRTNNNDNNKDYLFLDVNNIDFYQIYLYKKEYEYLYKLDNEIIHDILIVFFSSNDGEMYYGNIPLLKKDEIVNAIKKEIDKTIENDEILYYFINKIIETENYSNINIYIKDDSTNDTISVILAPKYLNYISLFNKLLNNNTSIVKINIYDSNNIKIDEYTKIIKSE